MCHVPHGFGAAAVLAGALVTVIFAGGAGLAFEVSTEGGESEDESDESSEVDSESESLSSELELELESSELSSESDEESELDEAEVEGALLAGGFACGVVLFGLVGLADFARFGGGRASID